MNKVKRVYLSSTYEDLIPYRQAAIAEIRRFGEPVSMERYGASDQPPLDKCLADVRSCDIYVGLFAHRYGFIPTGQEKSITELEYLAACEKGIPTLIFVVDEETNWSPRFLEHGPGYEKLTKLKSRLLAEKMVPKFHNPDNLATLVNRSLEELSGASYIPLIGNPKGTIADLVAVAGKAQDSYLKEMEAQRVYLPHAYARRIEVERHLHAFLGIACKKTGFLLVGKSGIGKTNTLCQIVAQWRDDPDLLTKDVVLLIGAASLPSSLRVEETILLGLQAACDFNSFTNAFNAQRRHENVRSQLVVIIDGIDKHPQAKDFLCQINQMIVACESLGWLKIVVSVGEVAYDSIRASGFSPSPRCYYTVPVNTAHGQGESAEIVLGRLTEHELREAYTKYCQDPNLAPLSPYESLTDDVKKTISYPLVLRIVMEVFSGQVIPRRILTTDVLCRYYEIKMDNSRYPRREDFVLRFADLLLDSRSTDVPLEAVRRDNLLRDSALDGSPQSAYVQLKEEQVLIEESRRPTPSRPAKPCVAFTYDRLLEYLIYMRIADRFGTDPQALAKVSHDNSAYLPIRGAFVTLLTDKVITGEYADAVAVLQLGEPGLMKAVANDLLMDLEQTSPTGADEPDAALDETRIGQLVRTMLAASVEWSVPLLLEFAERLQRLGYYRRCHSVLVRVSASASESHDRPAQVTALLALGNLFTLQGEHAQAHEHYVQCRAIIDTSDSLANFRPSLLRGIANNYYRLGKLDKALAACDDWLTTYTEARFRSLRADMLRIRGVVYRWNFRLDDALRDYQEGAALAEEIEDSYLRSYFCNNIGEVYRRRMDLDKAEEWHERARTLRRSIGDRSGLSMSCNNLALISRMRGDVCRSAGDTGGASQYYVAAAQMFRDGIGIASEIGDNQRKADALNNLGTTLLCQNQVEEANKYLQESYDLFSMGGSRNNIATVRGNLARLEQLKGRLDLAIQGYEESRRLFEEASNTAYAAFTYHNLAVLHAQQGRQEVANPLRCLATQAVKQSPDYPWPDAMKDSANMDIVEMPDI